MELNKPRCFLICVGSELLRGKVNTHSAALAKRLASLGLTLDGDETVGDTLPPLAKGIRRALDDFEIVFVTGGLGPTFDDLTREAAAEATGRLLSQSKPLLAGLTQKFRRFRFRKMPPANRRQADLLQGATAIANSNGTAPGQWLDLSTKGGPPKILILLPGPPSELYPMLDGFVHTKLKQMFHPGARAEAHLHFVGAPESVVDQQVRPIIEKAGTGIDFTILAHLGFVDLDIFIQGTSKQTVQRTLKNLVASVRQAVGDPFYGQDDDYPLEKVIGERFLKRGETLAVAESCTGGMLAARMTEIPGSSKYFLGGVVSYSNDIKESILNVPAITLKKYGAVSRETAVAMANGTQTQFSSTYAISITGIAGPDGGTQQKPVGTVFMAFASPQGTTVHEFHFSGNRSTVRQRAVISALDLLRKI